MKRDKAKPAKPSKPPVAGMSLRAMHLLAIGLLVGAVLLVYSNSLHAPFLLDNEGIVLKDARIHSTSSVELHRILTGQYWEEAPTGLYRPLITLSYWFNYTILGNGADPEGYHWINLLLHIANVLLVYLLGIAIFERIPAAFFLAGLWGLHPVQTEAVTNIVGRADLMAAFGVLAALLCHRRALHANGWRRAAWVGGVAIGVAAGMFSKESAVVAIAILVLHDFTFDRTASWRTRIPGYVAAVVPCLIFLFCRAQALAHSPLLGTAFTDNPLLRAGFWTARLTAVKVIGKYVLLWLWPARLSYDYSYNQIPLFRWNDWQAMLALAGCLAALALAVRSIDRHKPVFFAVGIFFITLSPTSNLLLLIGTIMAERFLYLPSLAFAVAAIYVVSALWRTRRQAAAMAVVIVLFAASARTWARNNDWSDPQRFWRSGADAAPGSYKTRVNAATMLPFLAPADWDRSIDAMSQALAVLAPLPDDLSAPEAYRFAGNFYRSIGERLASGSTVGVKAAGTNPEFWYRKSLEVLLRSETIEFACNAAYRAGNPNWRSRGITSLPVELYLALGRTYVRLGDSQRALEAFEKGRRLASDPDLLAELASAYRGAGQLHQAALALVEAVAVDSSRTQLDNQLVELYQQIDPQGCAVSHEGGALSLNTDCPLVHADICSASRNVEQNYLRRGQDYEASAIRRVATQELGCTATR